ncbi:MAG: glycosyltransferase family 4 protein [Vicinamibacterales bacterium]|jgi:glycosyltransferase involved in cell wall biosynthesis
MSTPVLPSVLWVTGAYYPEFSAGGLQCQAVAHVLNGRARLKVLTTATTQGIPFREVVDGVSVSRVIVSVASRWSVVTASARLLAELFRLMPRAKLVHIQGYSTKNILVAAVSRLFGRPMLIHLQTARHDEPETIRAHGALAWWAFSGADAYLSVSPGLTACYLEAGLPAGRIREIPNGVDAVRFAPASPAERQALRRRLHLPEDRPIVLFVGVMSPDKQPHVLFDAWLRMRRETGIASTLVFVGASNPTLYELADRFAERVRAAADASGFGGEVLFVPPTAAIEDYFRAADVFAMPSAREGLPIVLLEAMACGLPAVASRLPGSTDTMIESGVNGLLVPPGDVAAFAAGLADLLSRPAAAAGMGVKARRTVEDRYTIERVAEQWMAAYNDVLGRRP